MANKNVIGIAACPHCGSLQELRINAGSKLYIKCHGEPEGQACGFSCIWPRAESTRAIADVSRQQWLGPIPYGYFPPTKSEGNAYGHHFEKLDYETRRNVEPYIVRHIQRGKRPDVRNVVDSTPPAATPEPEPVAEPVAEPAPKRTDTRRRYRLGGGG